MSKKKATIAGIKKEIAPFIHNRSEGGGHYINEEDITKLEEIFSAYSNIEVKEIKEFDGFCSLLVIVKGLMSGGRTKLEIRKGHQSNVTYNQGWIDRDDQFTKLLEEASDDDY